MRIYYLLLLAIAACMASCTETRSAGSRGAIVLGDPSTIITEADSQYLKDMVLDYEPKKAPEPVKDTTVAAEVDTAVAAKTEEPANNETKPTEKETTEAPTGKGLKIALKEVTLFIPGIKAKGDGTSYMLTDGSVVGKEIRISGGGKVQKISQRYQTVVVAKNNLGTLVLDDLDKLTDWRPLRGTTNSYSISGIEARKLQAPKVTSATVRKAVTRAAREKRLSKRTEQKWLSAVRNVRSASQKPLSVKLRTVMWKVDGTDKNGKHFSRQVRVDIPI